MDSGRRRSSREVESEKKKDQDPICDCKDRQTGSHEENDPIGRTKSRRRGGGGDGVGNHEGRSGRKRSRKPGVEEWEEEEEETRREGVEGGVRFFVSSTVKNKRRLLSLP